MKKSKFQEDFDYLNSMDNTIKNMTHSYLSSDHICDTSLAVIDLATDNCNILPPIASLLEPNSYVQLFPIETNLYSTQDNESQERYFFKKFFRCLMA